MSPLLDETRAYLLGPDIGEHDLLRRLSDELQRALESEERLATEVYLCRRRLHDLVDGPPVVPHG
jgi:hypothetical protein